MNVDICEDSDFTSSVSDVPDSDHHYKVYEEVTFNPAYGCRHEEFEESMSNPACGCRHEEFEESTSNPACEYSTWNKNAAKFKCPEESLEKSNDNMKKYSPTSNKRQCCVAYLIALVVAVVLLIASGIAIIIAFMEISKLNSEISILQSTSPEQDKAIQAIQSTIDNELNSEKNVEQSLENISNSISTQQRDIDQLRSRVSDNTKITEVLDSCANIRQFLPSSPSGYYKIRSSNGSVITAYCDMTRSCGGITGGWMKVAELNMTDNTAQCPDSLELTTSPLRTCKIRSSSAGVCSSDMFKVEGVEYTKVCGRVKGYQVGSTNAFRYYHNNSMSTDSLIDTYYVDGVSLTHGNSPREHIWTFASAHTEDGRVPNGRCPCTNIAISSVVPPPPPFVGNGYFCDTAVAIGQDVKGFHSDDPLWDGAGCGFNSTCCSFNSPPWFYRQLPQATTDDIEMRVCCDEIRSYENIAIEIIELYVQ